MCSEKEKRTNKLFSGIMIVMMLAALMFSAYFLAAETHHDCTGDDCPVCACIELCESTIRNIGAGTAAPVIAAVVIALFLLPVLTKAGDLTVQTPVSGKVRLNN